MSNKGGDFNFATGGFGVGTNAEEWRNSGIGEAQEKACNDFVVKLVTKSRPSRVGRAAASAQKGLPPGSPFSSGPEAIM